MPGDDQQEPRRWLLRYCDSCGRGGVVNPDDDYLSKIMHRPGCEARSLAIREVEVAPEQATRQSARAEALREAAEKLR
jgi:hypothetical protein